MSLEESFQSSENAGDATPAQPQTDDAITVPLIATVGESRDVPAVEKVSARGGGDGEESSVMDCRRRKVRSSVPTEGVDLALGKGDLEGAEPITIAD